MTVLRSVSYIREVKKSRLRQGKREFVPRLDNFYLLIFYSEK